MKRHDASSGCTRECFGQNHDMLNRAEFAGPLRRVRLGSRATP